MPPRRKSKAGKKSSHAKKKIGKGGKRKTHRKEQTFAIYIHKVLKQVHPDTGISRRAMNVVNCFSNDILDRLAVEAGRLARHQKRQTILKKDCEQAVKLIIRGELKKHAISEGTKAYFKYTGSINKPRA